MMLVFPHIRLVALLLQFLHVSAAMRQTNWGTSAVTDQAYCTTRVLFECNKTATHGTGKKRGCNVCPACCHGDYISDGNDCNVCAREKCPKSDNCKVVLPEICGMAHKEHSRNNQSDACHRASA